jgi:hyperosmotically inducible periplasmic protein
LIIASGVALASGATGGVLRVRCRQTRNDARLEALIPTTHALIPHLHAGDITVSVQDGTATLTGVVLEDIDKEPAGQFARNVEGVTNGRPTRDRRGVRLSGG